MSPFELYLLTLLGALNALFVLAGAILFVLIVIIAAIMCLGAESTEPVREKSKGFIQSIILASALTITGTLIPSDQRLAVILGGYVVTNADTVEAIPDNTVKAINKFLESYVEDEGK